VTSKKHKRAIADSLSSALEPPKSRRPSPALNEILSQYAPEPPTVGTQSTMSTESTRSTAAPARDFQRVANSITRVAVPAGVFKGKCKQLYDFLYSKTRGAIVPSRSVRLTRREIMKGSDIGSTKTLFLNLRHLRDSGLVTWDERVGPHEGNIYTVHLPEEAGTMGTQGTQSTHSTDSASSPKVDRVLGVESTMSTHSVSSDFQRTSGESKTLIQDLERTDDEAAPLSRALARAERELTGRVTADALKWEDLADLLVTELKIAAGRTESVSSAPAFLAEHLRRRLWKKGKAQLDAETAVGSQSARVAAIPEGVTCPDCMNTGFFYPEGYDKGVARCSHRRLSKTEGD
jgi:hypothetical protein